jgi:Tfp pilus assembly protein PilO
MNKISKDKRDKVILSVLVFVGLAGLLYTFVLGAQKDRLAALHKQIITAKDKLSKAERLVRSAASIEVSLKENQKLIDNRQETMAPQGQYYYWFLKLMDQFRAEQKLSAVLIVDIMQPEFIEAGILPNFPYKAACFGIRLNGQFHDVGRFIADLENTYPFFRVQSVKMSPQRSSLLGGAAAVKDVLNAQGPTDNLVVEVRVVTLIRGATT